MLLSSLVGGSSWSFVDLVSGAGRLVGFMDGHWEDGVSYEGIEGQSNGG